ncbi:hypothetical protein EMCRGX_G008473 [Ephydatia muelleri]
MNLDPRDADPPPSTLQPTQSFLETAGKSLTLYMIGSSRLHRKMLETSRVEIDELPASIPWIVFDKARAVVKLFHTRRVHEDGRADALRGLGTRPPRSCCRPHPSWRLESLKKECVHRKLGHREDYPRLLRGDAAPAGPGGPGLPKEQDERWQVTDVCVSNGMAWSPGNTKMYHMDSGLRKLWSFKFDDVSSCLTNRQVCWWTSTTRGWGIPDAMCTDSEGRLWRAGFFGATIVLVGPSHRRAVGQDQVPSPSHDVILLLGDLLPVEKRNIPFPEGGELAPIEKMFHITEKLATGALLSGTPLDSQKNSFGSTLSTYPFNGIVGVSTVSDDDTWINRESTFLVKSGSFDDSDAPVWRGVFTSPSFGPVGSAVCVFNYATMANVFQTSSFVVRDTTTLVFNSVTGAPVDSQLCQYNLHLSTLNIVINRTVGLGTYTLDTFVTFSSNYFSPSCQYRSVGWERFGSFFSEDGKVVEGMDVVRKMEAVGSEDGDTSNPVVIKDCEMAK